MLSLLSSLEKEFNLELLLFFMYLVGFDVFFFFFNGIHLCKAEEISWSKLLMLKPRKLLLREEFK